MFRNAWDKRLEHVKDTRETARAQLSTPDKQAEPRGSFDEKPEPVRTFLANRWKLRETGQTHPQRLVLKIVPIDRLHYDRNKSAQIPEIAFRFKLL